MEVNSTAYIVASKTLGGVSLLPYIIIGALVLILVGVIWYRSTFKHLFLAKYITGGKHIVQTYKTREFTHSVTKAPYWKIWGKFKEFPKPPEEVILTTEKGKQFAEAYITSDWNMIFGQDPPEIKDSITKLKPFTTNQRNLLVQQFAKAEKERNSGFLAKYGQSLIVMSFLLIFFILTAVYWGDIMEPAVESQKIGRDTLLLAQNMTESNQKIMKHFENIMLKQQSFDAEVSQ